MAKTLKGITNRSHEFAGRYEISQSAEILPHVRGGLLYRFSHRFWWNIRVVSHTLGQENILANTAYGNEPQTLRELGPLW